MGEFNQEQWSRVERGWSALNGMSCLWPKGTLGKWSRMCKVFFFQLVYTKSDTYSSYGDTTTTYQPSESGWSVFRSQRIQWRSWYIRINGWPKCRQDTHSQNIFVQYSLFTARTAQSMRMAQELHCHLCVWKEFSHLVRDMSHPLLLSHAPSSMSTSSSSPTYPTTQREHSVHPAHLQAPSVDKLRHQESLWRGDLQSGGNPRTTTPTGYEPKEFATVSRIEAYSGDPYQSYDVQEKVGGEDHRAPITEELEEFGEIKTAAAPDSKLSETSHVQSKMHFDDSLESIADSELPHKTYICRQKRPNRYPWLRQLPPLSTWRTQLLSTFVPWTTMTSHGRPKPTTGRAGTKSSRAERIVVCCMELFCATIQNRLYHWPRQRASPQTCLGPKTLSHRRNNIHCRTKDGWAGICWCVPRWMQRFFSLAPQRSHLLPLQPTKIIKVFLGD